MKRRTLEAMAVAAVALLVVPSVTANSPPTVPPRPTGLTEVFVDVLARYCTAGSTDPDGDPIQYVFDFHDGTPVYGSSSTCQFHSWDVPGTYCVDVYAQDLITPVPARSPCLYVTVRPLGFEVNVLDKVHFGVSIHPPDVTIW